jgi:hypothetical protein
MNAKYKKSLKIVTLLITAALIATASAATYDYLNFSAGVGVESTLTLNWNDTGIDSGLTANIQGVYCTLTGLEAPAGGSRTYPNAIKLTSTAATTFDIQVAGVTTTGGSGTDNLESIVVNIHDGGGGDQGTLDVFSSGSAGTTPVTDLTMSGIETWSLEWVITWKATATASDQVTVTLKVTTPSQA